MEGKISRINSGNCIHGVVALADTFDERSYELSSTKLSGNKNEARNK